MTVTIKSQTRIKGNVRVNFPPTPSVYLDFTRGYANGLNPLPSTVTFTRADSAAVATQVGPNGLVRLAAHNMLTYSEQFNNAAWGKNNATVTADSTTSPDGTTTADTLVATGTSAVFVYQTAPTLNSGQTYTFSRYAKAGTKSFCTLGLHAHADAYFDLVNLTTSFSGTGAVSASIINVGGGWRRISATWTISTATNNNFFSAMASSLSSQSGITVGDTIFCWGAQLEQNLTPSYYVPTTSAAVYANTPRFDYDPVTLQPKGLLIEEQRVNIVTASNVFTNNGPFWFQNNNPAATTTNIAPDGTASAYSWSFSATNIGYYAVPVMTGNVTYAFSAYVKAISGSPVVRIGSDNTRFGGGANALLAYVDFTPSTGTFSNVQSGVVAYDKQDVGNGWWRIWLTATKNSTTESTAIIAYGMSAGTAAFWGYQVEHAGSVGSPASAPFITSLIPTTTASVTRALERAQLTGAALTVCQGSAVTLVSEAQQYSGAPTPRLISARKASGGNYTDYYTMSGLASTMRVGNSDQAVLTYSPAPTLTSICKTAFAFQANDFAAVANNGTVQTDGTGSIASGIDEAYIGYYTDGVYMNGWMRVAYLYNVRLSNDQIKAMTVVSPPTLTINGATTISGSTTVR